MSRLRLAVVGVGHLGRHHARILASQPDVELVGVADSRPEQAHAVAGPLNTQVFADYRELAGLIDAVSIAAPTALHREIGGFFLERGIPTLIEKPLASSLAEAHQLVQLAADHHTTLQVGHIERFNPALRAWNELGWEPKYIAAERLGTFTFRSTDIGVVHDLMIHDLDLLLSLVKAEVQSVSAVGVSIFGQREDVANARIEFENGCVANITASRASMQATRKMRLWAADGYASLDFATREITVVKPSEALREGDLGLDTVDLSQPAAIKDHIFGKMLHVNQVPDTTGGPDQLTLEMQDFVRAIRAQTPPRVTGADALRAMKVADLVIASLEEHRWEGTPEGAVGPRGSRLERGSTHHLPAPKLWQVDRRHRRDIASTPGSHEPRGGSSSQ